MIAAVYGSIRAAAPGGEMDQGYDRVGEAMAPLGLEVGERPTVGIEMRDPVQPRMGPKSRDGRVRPGDGAPAAIVAALRAVPNSTRWKRVEVEGGPEGIVVVRKGGEQSDWLCDLWLAERLASVL